MNEATRKAAEEMSRRMAQARARREMAGRDGDTDESDLGQWVSAASAGSAVSAISPDVQQDLAASGAGPSSADTREETLMPTAALATVDDQAVMLEGRVADDDGLPAAPGPVTATTGSVSRPLASADGALAPVRERHTGHAWGQEATATAAAAAAASPRDARRRVGWRSWPLLVLVGVLLPLLVLHVWPFEERRQQLEQVLSEQLGRRVQIETLRLSLLPRPHWRIGRLGVGEGDGNQAELRGLRAYAAAGSLFAATPQLQRLEVAEVRITHGLLNAALFAPSASNRLQAGELVVEKLHMDVPGLALPVLAARMQFDERHQWRELELVNSEFDWRVRLTPHVMGELKLIALLGRWPEQGTTAADAERLPATMPATVSSTLASPRLGALPLKVQQLHVQGQLSAHTLTIQELSALLVADTMQASMRATGTLSWHEGWQLSGRAEIQGLDAARLAPAWLASGRVDLDSQFMLQADTPAHWFVAPRLQGEFNVHRGSVLGVDLGRVLQGGGGGGQSLFAGLQGHFEYADQTLNLTSVRLESGAINAFGQLRVAPDATVRGGFEVVLRSDAHQRQAGLEVSGTLGAPRFELR